MKLLFVSGTTAGGSGRSQRDLAAVLHARGHTVRFLVDDGRPAHALRWAYEQLSDLSVRREDGPAGAVTARLRDALGRRVDSSRIDGLSHDMTALPQNALAGALRSFRPDVVVVSSVERWAWRRVRAICAERKVPTVLYVREEDSLLHLATGSIPTSLVANTRALATIFTDQGFDCRYVPSVIDTSRTTTRSTRKVALAVNPLAIKGGDVVLRLAERLPSIPFAVQLAWPLSHADAADLERRTRALPNVEVRPVSAPSPALYGDARVLLVPYRVASRPRVIVEAQACGIPVIANDLPALTETAGRGGVGIPIDDLDRWSAEISRMWADEEYYSLLCAAASTNSRRPDLEAAAVATEFEDLLACAARPRNERGRAR